MLPERRSTLSFLPSFKSRAWGRRSQSRKNQGVATVECALCLPLLFTITFGTIDLCSATFIKETLTIAAYEGARVGVTRGGTNAVAQAKVKSVLDARGITYSGSPTSFSAPGFDTADTLEHVTTTVSIPCEGNLLLLGPVFESNTLQSSVTMRKEFRNF